MSLHGASGSENTILKKNGLEIYLFDMYRLRHASLFTGIGGFDLAAQWMGWENVFQVEIDPFCQKVLEKNFPNVKRYGDIKEFDGTKYRGAIDVLSGGFPCQPFSVAGKRKGKNDDRYLWPEMLRVIREIQPKIVVGENVTGLVGVELSRVLSEVAAIGYSAETFIIPACAVQARHRRDRIWIIAYPEGCLMEESALGETPWQTSEHREHAELSTSHLWSPSRETYISDMDGGLHGISNWVDRSKSLGNAIVPQVAFEIFKAIEAIQEARK